jgi:hypothetical protein
MTKEQDALKALDWAVEHTRIFWTICPKLTECYETIRTELQKLREENERQDKLLSKLMDATEAELKAANEQFSEADFELHYTHYAEKHAELYCVLYDVKKSFKQSEVEND